MKPYLRRNLAIEALQKALRIRKKANIPVDAPVNPVDTVVSLGCPVRFEDIPSLEGIYSSYPTAIVLGSQRTAGRRAYTCAHEFGHHVFGHGTQVEQLNEYRTNNEDTEIEYSADMFAAFFLMHEIAVKSTLKHRQWDAQKLSPMQAFMLACYFGVSYSAIIYHLSRTLQLIPFDHAQDLLSVQPKEIKSRFNVLADADIFIVDRNWKHRAADLETDDTLIVPKGIQVTSNKHIEKSADTDKYNSYVAQSPGIIQAYDEESDWALNVRISKKNYRGLAEYRHLEDEEC